MYQNVDYKLLQRLTCYLVIYLLISFSDIALNTVEVHLHDSFFYLKNYFKLSARVYILPNIFVLINLKQSSIKFDR